METAKLFDVVGMIAMPGWLLLAVAPRWRYTQLITACILPCVLAAIYFTLMARNFGAVEGGFGNFNSLAGVRKLFELDENLLAGWIHYLAFDLFVGSWEVRDAQRLGIRHWFVLPCLFFTLMLGPVGLLVWWIVRSAKAREPFFGEITPTA